MYVIQVGPTAIHLKISKCGQMSMDVLPVMVRWCHCVNALLRIHNLCFNRKKKKKTSLVFQKNAGINVDL